MLPRSVVPQWMKERGISVVFIYSLLLSYFFVKKIPLSRHVKYVKDESMDHSVSE